MNAVAERPVLDVEVLPVFGPVDVPSRYIGLYGGRGSAKSHYFATRMVEQNIYRKVDCVCLREIQRSLEFSVKKLLEQKIAFLNAGYYFTVQDARILSKLGGVTIFQGMQNHTAESIKSLEDFGIAWIEEGQTLSQRSLDILRPTIRGDDSEIWASWNPRFPTDPVDKFFRQNPPPDAKVLRVSYKDNYLLPKTLRDELEYDRTRDYEKYLHIWEGEYENNGTARVFKNWTVEEFEPDPAAIRRQGADWGFAVDPTVLVQVYIVGRKLFICAEAYRVGCEIVDTPDLFMSVPDAEKWPITADSARPETISYMAKHGFPKIRPAIKGPKSLEEGVQWLQSFDIVVHPSCVHTIDELKAYSYKIDPLTNEVLPILEDKDNHVIDAIRYACEGARRAKVKVPPKPDDRPSHSHKTSWMS